MFERLFVLPVDFLRFFGIFCFHGAKVGRKYELAKKNPIVGFEIDGNDRLQESETDCNFSAAFQSLIGTGKLSVSEDNDEKRAGLNFIMKQVDSKKNRGYSDKMLDAVAVFGLAVNKLSCKVHTTLDSNVHCLETFGNT